MRRRSYHGLEQCADNESLNGAEGAVFSSSFYRDPDGVLNELIEMLTRMGIQPIGKGAAVRPQRRFTEHRIVEPVSPQGPAQVDIVSVDLSALSVVKAEQSVANSAGVRRRQNRPDFSR